MLALTTFGCKKNGSTAAVGEPMYVSAPQANLRDHVSTVYNRVGAVKNGERVEVLEKQKRFVRVRTESKQEGWLELRSLVPQSIFNEFQRMAAENRTAPVQGKGITRAELNMHVAPGRETDTLYQLAETAKVEILKRSTTNRATPEQIAAARAAELARISGEQAKPAAKKKPAAKPSTTSPNAATAAKPTTTPVAPATAAKPATTTPATPAADASKPAEEDKPKPMDDWWLVRDAQGHTGWVLSRMVDLDIPLDVVQYAEGQRIQAAFVLNTVNDEEKGTVAQYLVLMNENKDGLPWDFNQVRVFTWNLKRHRYETGYRERGIMGYFPAHIGTEDFGGKDGVQPVFFVRKQNQDGTITERKYRLIGNVVRQVQAAGEQPKAAKAPEEAKKESKKKSAGKSAAHPQKKKH